MASVLLETPFKQRIGKENSKKANSFAGGHSEGNHPVWEFAFFQENQSTWQGRLLFGVGTLWGLQQEHQVIWGTLILPTHTHKLIQTQRKRRNKKRAGRETCLPSRTLSMELVVATYLVEFQVADTLPPQHALSMDSKQPLNGILSCPKDSEIQG